MLVGVEGSPELDIQVTAHPRAVDVGELYTASQYVPSPRLVGAFGYVGGKEDVKVDVLRRTQYALPAALVERAELVTRVGKGGTLKSGQDAVGGPLCVQDQSDTPGNPFAGGLDALVRLSRRPAGEAPAGDCRRRRRCAGVPDRLLLTLPAQSDAVRRDLQIVYETPGGIGALAKWRRLPPPSSWSAPRAAKTRSKCRRQILCGR